ncbi:MAG: UvrD-helicase domain-containing protein, partial [Treponema sp.]|nr:UvrD-helicase domain-containing protein [Treponema sp.]
MPDGLHCQPGRPEQNRETIMTQKASRPELNEEQKNAAFCTENSVVSAGAGSGKTMVLANRFAWLITKKGINVNEILTLTFTRKAASQMYRRIYSLLSEIAAKENGVAAERAQKALDDFIHARIQTLDSYSASLVKQCASRYGISPDFKIDQERCYKLALEVSYPFLITHRRHPAMERLFSGNRPNSIVRNIFAELLLNYSQIDKPFDFSSDIKKQFNFLCVEWKNHFGILTKLLSEVEPLISENKELLPLLVPLIEKYKKDKINIPETAEIKAYFNYLSEQSVESCIKKAEDHPLQKSIVNFLYFLTSVNNLSLRSGKRSDNPVKENIKQIRELYKPFFSLAISCMQAGFTISFFSLLDELQKNYISKKRAEGVLTFRDAANLSRTILVEQHDTRQSEKESFKAIMIDEFQDNNELQKDLLFLLAEKQEVTNTCIPSAEDLKSGKLFFVGDEKQSIYLFRGADVSVFRKLKEELKSAELPLRINYRSSPRLIGAFNAIFGGSNYDPKGKEAPHIFSSVFAPQTGSAASSFPLYEASYTPLVAHTAEDEPYGGNKMSNLSICILNKSSGGTEDEETEEGTGLGADENEARFTAEKIKLLLKEKTEDGRQKYKGDDIAILLRTRSSQYLFEKHLRLLDISYSCEDITDLFYGGPVNDIMSVLRLASHPGDSLSYAEMLRSPFAGLTLSGTALCLSLLHDKDETSVPFDDKPFPLLGDEDKNKYLNGQKIYQTIRKKSESESICSLVSELWYSEGYRYETEWNPQTSVYRELFDYLFHFAANADAENQGLASFTDSMASFRDSGGRFSEIEIPLERPGAVHLMTIHKAKGLEFPVVFLCGCGKKSRTDSGNMVYFSDETGIVLNPPAPAVIRSISGGQNNFFWQKVKEETKRKRLAELRRLLYVGMTRAGKELYITGSLDIKNQGEDNFSLKLKKFTEEKCADSKNYIDEDAVLDNDTFFGLLLPSIASYIPPEGLNAKLAFFNLEEILPYTEEEIKKKAEKTTSLTNDQKGLNEFFDKKEPFYQKAELITTPVIHDNHKTPVSLQMEEGSSAEDNSTGSKNYISREYSGENSILVFKKADAILFGFQRNKSEDTEKFNAAGFGTIVHICVEARLKGKEPVIPAKIACLLNPEEF